MSFDLEKLKKSSLKNEENLKFIPVNLHMEQFIAESCFDGQATKRSCYDFSTVGAFTTVHVAKSAQKSVELLMKNSKDNNYKNEVFLNFYSLKIFILLLNDLKLIKNTEDKIQVGQ